MLKPPEKELEEVVIYVEYIILLPKSALRQTYNNHISYFSEQRMMQLTKKFAANSLLNAGYCTESY